MKSFSLYSRYFYSTSCCLKALLLLTSIYLSSCSWLGIVPGSERVIGEEGVFRDRQGDYLEAETIPRTQIPNGLDSYIIDDLLIIPELAEQDKGAFLEIPRPLSTVGRTERGVVIQRFNNQSWIVVDVSPSQVWPRIRDYWSRNNISMDRESPTEGILETGWFVLEGNVLTREKFKVTIEPGFQDESAEIRLLHLSMSQATPLFGQVIWPEVSNDIDLEDDMLNNLSIYLVDVADLYSASTVSFLAGNISNEGKASIVSTPAGRDLLRLEAGYARSWAAVGRALQRAGVDVVASNENAGIYEVEYVIRSDEDEEGTGLFRKVVTINGLLGGGEEAVEYHSLRVRMLESGNNGVEVLIENLDETTERLDNADEAEADLLTTIRDFIA